MLLTEYRPFQVDKKLAEAALKESKAPFLVKGVIQRAEAENHNGRIYPREILEKFNNKYKNLADNQKTLLKEYVNSVSNSPALKSFLNQEIKEVKKDLTKYSKKVEDKAVAIKLNETKGMIKTLCKKSSVNDDNVVNLLNYYELVNELKTIHG